jgi:hypothetical protein
MMISRKIFMSYNLKILNVLLITFSVNRIAGITGDCKVVGGICLRHAILLCWIIFLAGSPNILAQDVEPRAMTPAPTGTNIYGLSLSHSWGAVLLDKTLPVEDVDGYTTSLVPSFSRYINIFGMTGRFDAMLPIAKGEWDFLLGDSDIKTTRGLTGLGDPRLGIIVFLTGAEAMTSEQFRNYRKKTIIGFSFRLAIPLGQYDEDNLLNLGSNRWQIMPSITLSHMMGNWTAEAYASAWLFTENKSFLEDNVFSQDPLYAFQIHIGYNFKPGMWLSLGMRQTVGGETALNGLNNDDPAKSNRIGLVFGVPIAAHHTMKLIATTGTAASKGSDFNTLAIQWFIN